MNMLLSMYISMPPVFGEGLNVNGMVILCTSLLDLYNCTNPSY